MTPPIWDFGPPGACDSASNLPVRWRARLAGVTGRDPVKLLEFLRFTSERGRLLAELRLEDVYVCFTEASNSAGALNFLTFAMAHRRCERLQLPPGCRTSSPGSPLARINDVVRQLLDDDSLAIADRAAGLLVLLFAQRVKHVASHRVNDFSQVDGSLAVALGRDPVPLPMPVAAVVARHLAHRSNTGTTNAPRTQKGTSPSQAVALARRSQPPSSPGASIGWGSPRSSAKERPPTSAARPRLPASQGPAATPSTPLQPGRCSREWTGPTTQRSRRRPDDEPGPPTPARPITRVRDYAALLVESPELRAAG